MADRFRRVPLATEMNALETEIGCNQGFMAGGNAQHGAVVADCQVNKALATSSRGAQRAECGELLDARDQLSFGQRQGEVNGIAEKRSAPVEN